MSSSHVDRNLLFGFLALQNNFIDREDLIAAVSAWLVDKSRSLSDILRERKALDSDEFQLVEKLAAKHLERHGNDAEKTLAALETATNVCEQLKQLGDPDLDASIVHISYSQASPSDQFAATLSVDASQSITSRYRVMRPHAKGGLGEVFVAKDTELNRDVALKEIQIHHADDLDSRARFVLEAEITGGLEHPGIVPVYGFGAYPDGRPYYAMRFIRGASLKESIDQFHSRPARSDAYDSVAFRKLINRFIDVCNAIEYAHSRGVLHRDLKPGNIMLGKYGETLVVDWGLAKAKGRDELYQSSDEPTLHPRSSSGSAATLAGSAIGTPVYMSPEQAAGRLDNMGPASDIYSLGATLYSVLTSQTPFRKADSGTILRRVQKGDFPRPREINPAVPKPLEAICLKAMALAPIDRYGSAAALGEDLENWLADRPVSAQRETLVERARRWGRRHRALVQSAIAALALVAVVAVIAAVTVRRAKQSETVAKQQAQKSYLAARNAVDRWFTGVSDALRYAPGMSQMRQRLLEAASQDYQKFSEDRTADPDLEIERGRALLRLGDVQRELGNTPAANESFTSAEVHFTDLKQRIPALADRARVEAGRARNRRGELLSAADDPQALAVWRSTIELLTPEVVDSTVKMDRILVLSAAQISVAQSLEVASQLETARREIDATLKLLSEESTITVHQLAKPDPLLRVRLDALRLKARIESNQANWLEARKMLTQAESIIESQLRLSDADPWQLTAMGDTHIELAGVLRKLGLCERELTSYARALAAYRRLHETIPNSPEYFESIALTWLDRAQLLLELRRCHEAERDLNEALPMVVQLVSQFPDISRYRQELGVGLEAKGRFLHLSGKYVDAREALQQSVDLFTRLSDARPDIHGYRERAAVARIQLACTLAAIGQSQQSDLEFNSAKEHLDEIRTFAPDDSQFAVDVAWLHARRGGVLWQRNDLAAARAEFQQAIRTWTDIVARWPSLSHDRLLADLLSTCPVEALRNPKLAVELAQRCIETAPEESLVRSTFALALYRAGDLQEAVDVCSQPQAGAHPLARDDFIRALAHHALGEPLNAQQCFDQGMRFQNQQAGDEELCRLAMEAASILGLPGPQESMD